MEIEINKLKGQLEKHLESPDAIQILKELMQITVTPEVLKKTKIGNFIKGIKQKELKSLCTEIIAKWREDVTQHFASTKSVTTTVKDTNSGKSNERTFQTDVKRELILPEVRLKTVQFLYNALVLEDAKVDLVLAMAMKIEHTLFNAFEQDAYKEKFRSIYPNLKSNEKLRQSILLEEIKAEELIEMTADDMATDEIKIETILEKEKMMKDSMEAESVHASTDEFKCGKCKERKCTFYQLQTRSADEPMTTFVVLLY